MSTLKAIGLALTLFPLSLWAQYSALDVDALRAVARRDGSATVRVMTDVVVNASRDGAYQPTPEQERDAYRAQRRIMTVLIAKGLVVGNEVTVEVDGSFTVRLRPKGIEWLATSREIRAVTAASVSEPVK